MAVPTIRATNELTGTAAGTNHTVPLPAGVLAGDYLVVSLAWRGTGITISTPPTGWTSQENEPGSNINLAVYTKVAVGGDSNPLFVLSSSTSAVGQSIAITTATYNTATPINDSAIIENGSSVSCTSPSITTTVDECLLLFWGGAVGAVSWAPDAAMAELQESASNEPGNNCSGQLCSESFLIAGATGTRTSTLGSAQRNIACLLAIAPVAATPPATVTAAGQGGVSAMRVGAGASETLYYLIINTPTGERLAVVQDYAEINCARVVNGVGVLTFIVPAQSYPLSMFPVDGIVELWRMSRGARERLEFNQLWFIRERYKVISGNLKQWRIVAYDLNYLLGNPSGSAGRIVAYDSTYAVAANTTNAPADKIGAADDILKQVARENMASSVTDSTRDLTQFFFSVEADKSDGATVQSQMSRRNLLKLYQELCEASVTAGVYLAWDIVCVTPPSAGGPISLQLRTYINQRGIDHRVESNDPLLLGPDFGNLDDIELGFVNTDEANFIYAAGKGEQAIRLNTTASDVDRINVSPYNRREQFLDASNADGPTVLQDAADAALRAGRPLLTLSGRFIDTDQARYGVHWEWGDYVTAQVDGYSFDCRLDKISITFTQSAGETISIDIISESGVQ